MSKILMSACLLGQKVRYDGGDCLQNHLLLQQWFKEGKIVTICPEVAGGLSTPRAPAEIQESRSRRDVLNKMAFVKNNMHQDVTQFFLTGAEKALALVKKHHISVAILKAKSPSCGSNRIYDGRFTRTLINGDGVTAALLKQHGVLIFDENHIENALQAAQNSLNNNTLVHLE
ncbi:DUF523 domain-containing protein [Legionella maceachernii]|uniref:Uncharacterized protein n=1 Tax=Legionella maceachernii TaxID=466 RepID=A0A0W0VVC0_9GAMM|nr:DUF523 domain-containing protein [Legionella maceachernii]KTD24192.1 hypothetical protein Lmac_3065 [Legionella maceachernii]SJZ88792.1 Uncharacterized conserved protein YbbK, DUF523 family [Legionella maceachernii]SUO98793.1 Uncharacterized conserved protein [Legionella maceachernii]